MGDTLFPAKPIDVDVFFRSDVEALVISAHKAALDGIERLDNEKRPKPNLHTNPEAQVELDVWDQQIADMKRLAGNMALVSLVTFFDDWLTRKHRRVLGSDGPHGMEKRFKALEGELKPGPLTADALRGIKIARDSIIHHQGAPAFEWNGSQAVNERFLDFDDVRKPNGQVGISDEVLSEVTQELAAQVKTWLK